MTTGGDHDDDRAEARRRALRRVLQSHGLSPADAARRAGLPTANALYNFLNRRTRSLSQQTYEAIAQALPDTTVSDLTSVTPPAHKGFRGVALRTVATAGLWRDRFELPLREQVEIPLPATEAQRLGNAFAVRVAGPGAEQRWPNGAVLLCMPPEAAEIPLAAGRWVVVERVADGKVEVTARQVVVDNGRAWLWLRSSDPRQAPHAAVPVSWPCDGRPWRHGNERFRIAGFVEGAWEPMDQA